MLSAIRKFFKPQGGGHQKLQQESLQQQLPGEEPKAGKPPRLRGQDRASRRGASGTRAPLKGPPCGLGGRGSSTEGSSEDSESGGSETSDDSSSSIDDAGSCGGDAGSSSSSSSGSSTTNSEIDNGLTKAATMQAAVTEDGDRQGAESKTAATTTAVDQQQQTGANTAAEEAGYSPQQGAGDEDDDFDDEDYCDEESRVAFIAEAPKQQQQPNQQHHAHQRTLPPNNNATLTTSAPAPVQRKTEVDQLLTGASTAATQRRDSVRGNLEELRVAESVNYRPVVYKYGFRVPDVPANMRVFTDPDDRRIEAIARSCDSQIHLEKLPVRAPGSLGLKMRRVTIQSPDLHSLEKCCRQFDDRFPHFYVSGGLGMSSKSIQRVYVDELDQH